MWKGVGVDGLYACAGLVYKKGKFSATEEAQLAAAIERYRVVRIVEPSVGVRAHRHPCRQGVWMMKGSTRLSSRTRWGRRRVTNHFGLRSVS